jgi:hypothetical protein
MASLIEEAVASFSRHIPNSHAFSHFLKVFHGKILIYEVLTVQTQIRLQKRDPCTRIYVFIDHFEVKH